MLGIQRSRFLRTLEEFVDYISIWLVQHWKLTPKYPSISLLNRSWFVFAFSLFNLRQNMCIPAPMASLLLLLHRPCGLILQGGHLQLAQPAK